MQDTFDLTPEELCFGCVYHPPNLPPSAYSEADWTMLQARTCAFKHIPGTDDCQSSRKTSCSLVDLDAARQSLTGNRT